MTVQCCVCKKVKVEESWTITGIDRPKDVSHTYCPVCLRQSQAAMAAERLRANVTQPVTATA